MAWHETGTAPLWKKGWTGQSDSPSVGFCKLEVAVLSNQCRLTIWLWALARSPTRTKKLRCAVMRLFEMRAGIRGSNGLRRPCALAPDMTRQVQASECKAWTEEV